MGRQSSFFVRIDVNFLNRKGVMIFCLIKSLPTSFYPRLVWSDVCQSITTNYNASTNDRVVQVAHTPNPRSPRKGSMHNESCYRPNKSRKIYNIYIHTYIYTRQK